MVTAQAIAEFMASRGGLRPRSRREYENHLALFQRAFPDLPETAKPIQWWLDSFQLAPETINNRFRTIKAFYKEIVLWHPIIRYAMPLVMPPRMPVKAILMLSEEHL